MHKLYSDDVIWCWSGIDMVLCMVIQDVDLKNINPLQSTYIYVLSRPVGCHSCRWITSLLQGGEGDHSEAHNWGWTKINVTSTKHSL